jgi:ABC-type proline/glycine betaine transport system ATPase subunit
VRKTVIIVTHDMGEAFALADRVGVLDEGQLVACDRPAAVARSRDPRVRRLLDALPAAPAGAALHDRGDSGAASPPS